MPRGHPLRWLPVPREAPCWRATTSRAMADWKSSVDAELASLRAQEAALKQAGKKAELKAIAKRKGELKLMKKKGISPVILNPSMSMPSMPSMPSNFPSVPAWVSNFPNFTMPSEEDATEFAGAGGSPVLAVPCLLPPLLAGTLSFGTLTGFCSGYALKGIGRAGAFTVGRSVQTEAVWLLSGAQPCASALRHALHTWPPGRLPLHGAHGRAARGLRRRELEEDRG